ncbi:hypothetical protein MLD38_027491 [Melastoma candidum]|uniref:Uncharacterized protein n=1 Tax=Melastoma candidum TaxID=119954 RepID=A0ACB9P1P9_9MYRT|nr:hypothetical protein MLD38_027491 [Melastoma candidum]
MARVGFTDLWSVVLGVIAATQPFALPGRYNCSLDGTNCAENSTYQANLRVLLASLASSAAEGHLYQYSSVGSKGGAPVYGSFLCRGNTWVADCRDCVKMASGRITQLCPKSRTSIIHYDLCMLRYADREFDSVVEKNPLLYSYNEDDIIDPDKFNKLLRTTIDRLIAELNHSGVFYLHSETVFMSRKTLYLFAQCTPDLSGTDCADCLSSAAENLKNLESAKTGGRVLLPSCFMRYEIYPFYEINSDGTCICSPFVVLPKTNFLRMCHADDRYFSRNVTIAFSASAAGIVITIIACCVFLNFRIKQGSTRGEVLPEVKRQISELDSLQFQLAEIEEATGNFSDENKLGEGGFGAVYKGTLPDGQEIAAKRLSRFSGQGAEEFKNEVESVAKLQHRNLVRLLGYSMERDEAILVYEYVLNGSLDRLLFISGVGQTRRQLDWTARHKIVQGVARGLLYLHEDSRLRVIHRDIKASNILLDADMNPKISDFGMARIFGAGQTQANTNRIVGTIGYLPPEYMSFGEFSVKSDVFSFGILVLEIITGKKNNRLWSLEWDDSLLGYVWKNWSKGTLTEVVDDVLGDAYSVNEAIRCLHVGLLCVQDEPDDRPTMDSVLLMLSSDSTSLPMPLRPMFFFTSGKYKRCSRTDPPNNNSNPPSPLPSGSITHLEPR